MNCPICLNEFRVNPHIFLKFYCKPCDILLKDLDYWSIYHGEYFCSYIDGVFEIKLIKNNAISMVYLERAVELNSNIFKFIEGMLKLAAYT